jgi:hypothetical protein
MEINYWSALLIVVGAGASHDCFESPPRNPIMPPLAKDLAITNS